MCLKNLPPDVTKKDIADLIRKRSRSQPQYIDLGIREDGTPRRYAHVTVEGLKGVIEVLNGANMNGYNVIAEQAAPHYAFKILEAKRAREKIERDADEARQAAIEALQERLAAQGDTINKEHPPKSFFHGKQRYARIAAEIANKMRLERAPQQPAPRAQQPHTATNPNSHKLDKRKPKKQPRVEKVEPIPEPPAAPEPPQPTKDQRKLAGLQAKLLALKEKMKK